MHYIPPSADASVSSETAAKKCWELENFYNTVLKVNIIHNPDYCYIQGTVQLNSYLGYSKLNG